MTLFATTDRISKQDRRILRDVSNRFALDWSHAQIKEQAQAIAGYLPNSTPVVRSLAAQDLVSIDLRNRWRHGEQVLLEQYLGVVDDLGGRDELSAELVFDEFQTRCQNMESVSLDSYRTRFPNQFSEVERLSQSRTLAAPQDTARNSDADLSQLPESQSEAGTKRPPGTKLPPGTERPPGDTKGASDKPLSASGPLGRESVLPVAGDYRLIEKIGRGQYGEVWKAEAPGGVHVALKIINWPIGNRLTQMELRALELMKRLGHPFLIQLQAYWLVDDQLVMALELADGSLEDLHTQRWETGEGEIPPLELVRYISDAAEALDFLHEEGILHRDIKPANILLAKGHAKIGDFGLARLLGKNELVMTATLAGTALYMAPEVWFNKASRYTDQYALAATYVELRLNRPLYNADSQAEVMRLHIDGKPDLDALPVSEQSVVRRALAKEPTARFPTCGEFVAELRSIIDKESANWKEPARKSGATLWWTVVLLLVLVCGGAAGVAWVRFGGRDKHPVAPSRDLALHVEESVRLVISPDKRLQFAVLVDGATDPNTVDVTQHIVNETPDSAGTPRGLKLKLLGRKSHTQSCLLSFELAADLQVPAFGKCFVEITASEGKQQKTTRIPIQFHETVIVPSAFTGAPGASRVRDANANVFLDRIVPDRAIGWQAAETDHHFVLVDRNRGTNGPAPFYIMVNKVSYRFFAAFVESQPGTVSDENWRSDLSPLLPVVNVGYADAWKFAQWLNGRIPSADQWDKAAGYWDHEPKRRGPYLPDWTVGDRSGVGVNQSDLLPIGTATKDISPFGCRDMSGNGYEWTASGYTSTGDFMAIKKPVEAPRISKVILRGQTPLSDEPLAFSIMRNRDGVRNRESETLGFAEKPDPATGFRIVVEVPINEKAAQAANGKAE